MTTITRLVLTIIVVSLASVSLFAQSKCLSPDEAKAILEQVNSPRPVAFNKNLREELVKLAGKSEKLIYNSIQDDHPNDNSRKHIEEARQQDNARLCQILKDFGWPTSALAGADGVSATLYLVGNSRQSDLQVALLPVIVAAAVVRHPGKGHERLSGADADRGRSAG